MITKVVINNNVDTPIEYLSRLGAFKNGQVPADATEGVFAEGF